MSDTDLTGTTIERYKIIRELGRGGMAVVYRAVDTMLDRNVAIKMILSDNASPEKSEKLLRRFNREAKILASLSHPNIVKVLDYGEHESTPYLVMEFVSGGALRAKMGKPMPFADAAAMLAPIARALQHAHQQRIVHRDVKPENILINDSNQPMLSDFGILKLVDLEESHGLTGTGKIVGTPAYMSPEQIRGREVDGRADMYSLGIVFFEMIAGRKPYSANTPIELSMQHLHDPIPKAKQFVRDLPPEVDQILTKSLAKNPEDRYPNMSAFAQALEKLSGTKLGTTTSERRAMKAAEEKELEEKRTKRSIRPAYFLAPAVVVLGIAAYFLLPGLRPTASAATTNTTLVVSSSATISPTKVSKEATKTTAPQLPSPSATSFVFNTSTPVLAPVITLSTGNISQVTEVGRLDKISVIDLDWIDSQNWLVDSGSGAISFIDPQSVTVKQKVSFPSEIPLAMTDSPANNRLYVLFNNSIKVIDTQTFKVIKTFSPITGGAISIAASPDGSLLALGISDNKTQLLNAEDGSVKRNLRSNYGGWAVAFSPDSQYILSGTSQGVLKWETASGLWQPINGGQTKIIKTLAFSHDGKFVAGAGDGFIYFWNVADGEIAQQITGQFGAVNSMDFSQDDSMLVSGTDDGVVRVWNVSTAALLKELTGHTSRVFGVCFSPDGQRLASGANEGTIRIWGLP